MQVAAQRDVKASPSRSCLTASECFASRRASTVRRRWTCSARWRFEDAGPVRFGADLLPHTADRHEKELRFAGNLGAGLDYTLSNWAALRVYTEDGWLDIDNNEGENSIRGLCLGRQNWLFLGSDRGGRAAAIHFSLLASCKRHGHDPRLDYRDVLTRLPALLPGASEEELLALLPHRWRPA